MQDSEQWVSWDEASRLAGVPVPTVEHAVRVGRIARRPAQGTRPSLERESVLKWASWYRDLQSERAVRRRARAQRKGSRKVSRRRRSSGRTATRAPTGAKSFSSTEVGVQGWVTVPVAALALGCTESTVLRWADAGLLDIHVDGRALLSTESVKRLVNDRAADAAAWVTHADAAVIVGCSSSKVADLVAEGLLVQRRGPRTQPSISRESAESAAVTWAERQREAAEAAAERRRARPTNRAPEDGQVWVTAKTAALALGLTPGGVSARVRAGTLPGTLRGNRLWLRRVDVESVAAAQVFAFRRDATR